MDKRLNLLLQREQLLTELSRDGVVAANRGATHVRQLIQNVSIELGLIDPLLVLTKPGYKSKMIHRLAVEASRHSVVSSNELVKLANWLIENASQKGVPVPCNTGTLSHR